MGGAFPGLSKEEFVVVSTDISFTSITCSKPAGRGLSAYSLVTSPVTLFPWPELEFADYSSVSMCLLPSGSWGWVPSTFTAKVKLELPYLLRS